jgi:hypothetical protein
MESLAAGPLGAVMEGRKPSINIPISFSKSLKTGQNMKSNGLVD